ncbi:MAG: hypothetical protein EOP50_14255 [Sphingobacteriales bacterium]|nr:MAG: hypothetical protein EOP50_14255 [Sphingobacteriales bacterium]
MTFDFHTEYSTWTDDQLRAVLQTPDDYQPAAVAAAEALLLERGAPLIVEEAAPPPTPKPMQEWVLHNAAGGEETNLLEVLLQPQRHVFAWPERNWMRALFVLTALTYAYSVFLSVLNIYRYVTADGAVLNFPFGLAIGFLLLYLFTLYLAARGDSWGWYLVGAQSGFQALVQAFAIYFFMFRMPGSFGVNFPAMGLELVVHILILAGILSAPVRAWFGVGPGARRKMLLVSFLLWLGYFALIYGRAFLMNRYR